MASSAVFGSAFVVFGMMFSLVFAIPFIRSFKTRSWKKEIGKVYSSSVSESYNVTKRERSYKPVIRYQYSYEGKGYRGKCLGMYSQNLSGYHFSMEMIEKYKPDEVVSVYVNPSNPNEAVLEKGPEFRAIPGIVVPQVFVVFGMFILLSGR